MNRFIIGCLCAGLAMPITAAAHERNTSLDTVLNGTQEIRANEITFPNNLSKTCLTLSKHLEEGRLDELIIEGTRIDLDGDGIMESLIPIIKNEDGLTRSYDIVSDGDEENDAGFGLDNALSILFLHIDGVNYVWSETAPNISSLRHFRKKIDTIWTTDLICQFQRK